MRPGRRRKELPRPDLVLRAGVIGNIEIPDQVSASIARTAESVFRSMALRMEEKAADPSLRDLFSNAPPTIRIVSGLAAGADQILTETALFPESDRGSKTRFDLHCVFPFEKEKYRNLSITDSVSPEDVEFAGDRFDRLETESSHTVQLDGVFSSDPKTRGGEARHRAYRAQAWFVLQQADFLIAAFDRSAAGSPGGSLETVKRALDLDIPVVWLDLNPADGEETPLRILSRRDALDNPGRSADPEVAVFELIDRLTAPPELPEEDPRDPRKLIDQYYSNRIPRTSYRNVAWKLFLRVFSRKTNAGSESRPVEPFEQYRRVAAQASRYNTNRYRGAFLLNYLLAIAVVVIASLEFIFARGYTPIYLAILKLAVLAYILWNAFHTNRSRWQRQGIDYRILSELLRSANYLAPLGVATPSARLPAQYARNDLRHSWVTWLFRSIVRAEPIVVVEGSGTKREFLFTEENLESAKRGLSDFWISGQLAHHRANATVMGTLFRRLEQFNRWLIYLMFAATFLQAGLDIQQRWEALQADEVADAIPADGPGNANLWLIFVAGVAPAVITSLAGISYQSECRRLSERSLAMSRQLELWQESIRSIPPHPHGSNAFLLAGRALSIAQVMADEVADWHTLYQVHEVSAA